MTELGPSQQPFQDKVGAAIFVAVLSELVGGGLIGYGLTEGGRIYTISGAVVIGGGALFFSASVLMTVAAGVDYLKQIADNQSALIAKKRSASAASLADQDAEHRRQLGRLVE